MIRKSKKRVAAVLLALLLAGCTAQELPADSGSSSAPAPAFTEDVLPVVAPEDAPSDDEPLVNKMAVGSVEEIDYEVHKLYVTVYPTLDEDGKLLTREAFEKHQARDKSYNPTLNATIWENAPDGSGKDCTIRVRGNSSRGHVVKSFKVNLLGRGETIFGTDALNLNKHMTDTTRATNKTCMDLMQLIPQNMVSLDSKFVQLFINDLDEDGNETGFQDQGLYSWIEQPNKEFLVNHGLDINGAIYKPRSFEFRPYEDEIRTEDDPLYDEALLNTIITPMVNQDNAKLRKMLDAVNDYGQNYEQVFQTYFDEDNYLTWMAANVLLGNMDTLVHNMLLYSPSNSDKWYFLPWDYDGTLSLMSLEEYHGGQYQSYGINNYWAIPMHQRYFRIGGNVEKLDAKISELHANEFSEENIRYVSEKTLEVLDRYLTQGADLEMRRLHYLDSDNVLNEEILDPENPVPAFYQGVIERVTMWPQIIEMNYQRYVISLQSPTAGHIQQPVWEDGQWVFRWDASFDFQKDPVTYEFILARDWQLTDIVHHETGLTGTTLKLDELPEGHLYYRYLAYDSNGNMQYPLTRVEIELDGEGNRGRGLGYYYNDGTHE